ncbi:thioredoxin family protein [Emticicia sp. SJ17W-69]|uniref:thioredoxin family protein n=1 Tax=Emticicia sp. SJ17W-69 TaxID=3421657 RepID=UPI003EB86F32
MKNIYSFLVLMLISTSIFAQNVATNNQVNKPKKHEVEWLTLQEAYLRTQKEPRKTIIDVYTAWCGWCKVMDKQTYTNPELIDYLNKNFYMVKLDAESKQDIIIGNSKYVFDEKSGANQAAVALLQGKMSYPTTVFLDTQYNMIQPLPGYLDAKAFHQIVTYLGGDYNKKEPFEKYKEGTYKEVYKSVLVKL